MIDIDAIESAARKATPGPWTQAGIDNKDRHWMREVRSANGHGMAWCGALPETAAHANAAYIAACDPTTIIALCQIARTATTLANEGGCLAVEAAAEITRLRGERDAALREREK